MALYVSQRIDYSMTYIFIRIADFTIISFTFHCILPVIKHLKSYLTFYFENIPKD